jgi:uncharacterized NAD(P)/FAD-binding protein YdhS
VDGEKAPEEAPLPEEAEAADRLELQRSFRAEVNRWEKRSAEWRRLVDSLAPIEVAPVQRLTPEALAALRAVREKFVASRPPPLGDELPRMNEPPPAE